MSCLLRLEMSNLFLNKLKYLIPKKNFIVNIQCIVFYPALYQHSHSYFRMCMKYLSLIELLLAHYHEILG